MSCTDRNQWHVVLRTRAGKQAFDVEAATARGAVTAARALSGERTAELVEAKVVLQEFSA